MTVADKTEFSLACISTSSHNREFALQAARRWAGRISQQYPQLDDDGIYYRARAIVGAEIQAITYGTELPRNVFVVPAGS